MLHVNFDILLGCFFVTCVWLQFAEQTNPHGGVKYEIFFRHLSNKTIYVKLRHHYFVAVLQAYTLYYAQDQQG